MLAERLFLGKYLERLPGAVRHVYTMVIVLVGWCLFAVEDMGHLGTYLAACFGGARFISANTLYYLRSYLPMLVILVLASTPAVKTRWNKLDEKVRLVVSPVLVMGALVLCTACLVDASYNPFLYFRF